jgi:16S rRNA (uracil1498-N3)-methyltransferase
MPRFFTETINETKGTISGDDAKHIAKVLRMHAGEKLVACDCQGFDYDCVIDSLTDKEVELSVERKYLSETEPSVRVTLYQAMPKSDKMELIIQKAVELGVSEIIPVEMKRCIVRLEPKKADSKIARWQAIAESAAKQSKCTKIATVKPVLSFTGAMEYAKNLDMLILPYENKDGMKATLDALKQIKSGQKIGIMIGPEGGFEDSEIEIAGAMNAKIISLGKRILRTETAAITAMSMLMLYAEMSL